MSTKERLVLKMQSVRGVGRLAVKRLIDRYGNIEDIFSYSNEEIASAAGVSQKTAAKLLEMADKDVGEVDRQLEAADKAGYDLYIYGDPGYPAHLAKIYDPPVVLYARGIIKQQDANAVAIVGTRKASEYGKNAARIFAGKIAACDITVVSGCAVGIDTWAHKGALESGGRTIAVLGSGLDVPYPARNRSLMDEIASNGAVISEFSPGTGPEKYHFPLRNRIVSGLSLAVIVIEAPERSGALITAYSAIDQGREVYAVPGGMFSKSSRGCNDLIKRGAVLADSPEYVIGDLIPVMDRELIKMGQEEYLTERASSASKKILNIMTGEPVHIDEIIARTGIKAGELAKEMTYLEVSGRVVHLGGKRYSRNE